jgi:poly-beta-1,6-N-acetyl-D-glucosamine synthase
MSIGDIYLICITYGFFNLLTICLLIILANVHDIKDFRHGRIAKTSEVTPQTAPFIKFSIIIPAHNEEKVIARCLQSIVKLDYRDFEVIILNDGSKDETDKAIRAALINFDHSEAADAKGIRFLYVGITENRGKASVMNEGLALANGEVIVCMDADATFKPDALSRAAVYFTEPRNVIVAVNNKLVINKGWLGILQRFDFIANYRSKKAYEMLNAEYIVSGIGAMYRKHALEKIGGIPRETMTEDIDTSLMISLLGNKYFRIVYAEDIVTYMEPVHSFRDLLKQRFRWKFGNMQAMFKSRKGLFGNDTPMSHGLRFWRFPMAIWSELSMLVELAFMGFMIWLSVFLGNGLFLLASYIVATVMCAATVLADESETKEEKSKLIRYIPVMYFLSLVMNAVQLYASIRCLLNIRQLWKPKRQYAWQSPERHGAVLPK